MNICVCIGCGCDDENPCLDTSSGKGCSWLRSDEQIQLGVCSCCPDQVARFDVQDFEPTEAAMEKFAKNASGEWDAEREDATAGLLLPGDYGFDETLRNPRRHR